MNISNESNTANTANTPNTANKSDERSIFDVLKCPVCGGGLFVCGGSLVCRGERRHCFDIASSGYVNLLPPGKAKNAHTGDDKTMISARAEFLNKGYYLRISERLGTLALSLMKYIKDGEKSIFVIDAGCGEGYHTCGALKILGGAGADVYALGFDASKHGASSAAKRARRGGLFCGWDDPLSRAFFAAGNIFELPVRDSSCDFVFSSFAPIAWEESFRALKNGGFLITVSAGESHLFELRELLYSEPRKRAASITPPRGFDGVCRETLSYKTEVVGEKDIMSLFTMTPFYYRTSREDREKLSGISSIDITVESVFSVYKKVSEG